MRPGERSCVVYRVPRSELSRIRLNIDAGTQYVSLALTDALREAGMQGSIGSVGDVLDNALMESTIGLYKAEMIDLETTRRWTGRNKVERETADWVRRFNGPSGTRVR